MYDSAIDTMESDSVLVTGGAGFMGSHLAQHLLDMGKEVVVVDDLSGGFIENVPEGAIFVEGDVRDQAFVANLFDQYEFDVVYHLAAYAAEGLSHFIKKYNYETNLIASINLINEAVKHDVRCFVFTSSIAVYGANQLPMTEDLTPMPEDPYGISKYAIERELEATKNMFGMDYVIFRPHNVYGEHQNIGDRYRNVIGIFMNRIMDGKPMPIFGDGTQTRSFSYVGDVTPVIAESAFHEKASGQVFNVGADKPYSVLELAETVARAMGVEPEIEYHEERKEVKHAYADHSKARDFFGRAGETSLEEGVQRMADWAQKVGSRKSKDFSGIEITKNLPPSWL